MKKLKPKNKRIKARGKKPARRLDTSHQDRVRANALQTQRKLKGKSFELTGDTVLAAMNNIDENSETLSVVNLITSETENFPVVRLTKLASLLDMSYQTVWRWTSETNQLPEPILVDNTTGKGYTVYHVDEVRVILSVVGQHLNQFKYYRKDHETTRTKLFDQIDALRVTNFNSTENNGEQPNGNQAQRQNPRKVIRKNTKSGRRRGSNRG